MELIQEIADPRRQLSATATAVSTRSTVLFFTGERVVALGYSLLTLSALLPMPEALLIILTNSASHVYK
jgi:hypothetical protein